MQYVYRSSSGEYSADGRNQVKQLTKVDNVYVALFDIKMTKNYSILKEKEVNGFYRQTAFLRNQFNLSKTVL